MIKKVLYLLALAMTILQPCGSAAQQSSGRWEVFPTVGAGVVNVTETPSKVYIQTGPSLVSLSDSQEEYMYSVINKLSDASAINFVRYNDTGKYLFIAYGNGNIDILYDNGKVVNMPDIKDAEMSVHRGINDVAFNDGKIYVATDFGIVVFDDTKHRVYESGIFNTVVGHIMVMDGNLVLASGGVTFFSPLDVRHNSLDKFNQPCSMWGKYMEKLDEEHYVFAHNSGITVTRMLFSANDVSHKLVSDIVASGLFKTKDGVVAVAGDKLLLITPENHGTVSELPVPSAPAGEIFVGSDVSSLWVESGQGLSHVMMKDGNSTIVMENYRPNGATMQAPAYLEWDSDAERLYMANIGISHVNNSVPSDAYSAKVEACVLHDGRFSNVVPAVVESDLSEGFTYQQNRYGTNALIGGGTHLSVDPDDPDICYVGSWVGGVFALKDGKILNHLTYKNVGYTPSANCENTHGSFIDPGGNLWFVQGGNDGGGVLGALYVLPSSKRKDIAKVQSSDWKKLKTPDDYYFDRDCFIAFSRRSDITFISDGKYGKGLLAMDNNGTPDNFNDDRFVYHRTITDQEGNDMNLDALIGGVEDKDGRWWFHSAQGLWVIDRAADAMSDDLRVRRPVVPRNDGTDLGDYLLSTDKIYKIAVDPSNRKWIATENSGIYLVSADGTEILEHFTADNSPLLSDCVYSVTCAPNSNKVYISTANGLMSYDSDSSPAADDYSGVYAYPNPVRPEYSGWITIAGLMDNSLVKIADAAGNVFFQGRSEGGMLAWDGCDSSGRRVRSGVYYVFASQNATGSASGAVAKILVVN